MSDSRKKSLLQRKDRWGHGLPLWIVVAVGFVLPLLLWSLRDLKMHNDVAGWLPRNDPQAKVLSWYQGLFPSEDRILVAWETATMTDERLQLVKSKLQGVPVDGGEPGQIEGGHPLVKSVNLPADVLARMTRNDIELPQALNQLDGVLIGQGPLKIRLTDVGRMSGDYLKKQVLKLANEEFQLNASIVEESSDGRFAGDLAPPSTDGIESDDVAAADLQLYLDDYVRNLPLYDFQLTWPTINSDSETTEKFQAALSELTARGSGSQTAGKKSIDETFRVPGAQAAISVALSEAGTADKKAAVQVVRQALIDIGIPDDIIRMGGQPVVSVALNQAVADAGWNKNYPLWDLPHRSPILLSAVVGILFSFIMLRSLRLALLVQVSAFLTVVATLALIPLSGGTMNMVLIVMPTLLAVLTASAAIHLSNYWKHSGFSDPSRSVFSAARTAWLPCSLAAGTTSIGMASLVASNLVPVRDFGIYSAIGCLFSFVVVLYVLPSLMLYWPKSPPSAEELNTDHWKNLGIWLARNRRVIVPICLVVSVGAGWGLNHFRTETKVIRYFPTDSRLVTDYEFLERQLSGVISIDTIVKFDEPVQGRGKLNFLQRAQIVQSIQNQIRQHDEISGVLSLASFIKVPGPDEKISRLKSNTLRRRIHKAVENGETAAGMMALPEYSTDWVEAGDMRLNREGDEVWRITAQTSALSETNLETLINDLNEIASSQLATVGSPGTGHVVTGLIPVFLRTQQAVLESLITSFGLAFVLIAIIMMCVLRSPASGLFTMLPNLMPVAVVFGLLSWMRLKVDIGTMITASVALGIAVDGTLHLLTWFRELVSRGIPVEEAVGRALEHCGPAMWQTSTAIGLGMLALLPADLLLVSRFGWMMAALIFAALVADIIFLPALLGGTLGRLIRNASYEPPAEEDTTPATVSITEAARKRHNSDRLKDVS